MGAVAEKYAEQAKIIDLEIFEVKGNSPLQVGFACTAHIPMGRQYPMFPQNLLKLSGKVFLESLRAESKGELRNAAVRRYLLSLPPGVTRQEYKLQQAEEVIDAATIGDVNIASLPEQLPYLDKIEGDVVGVGFAPGPNEVRIKQKNEAAVGLSAREDHISMSLGFRGAPVIATVLAGKTKRLLSLRLQDSSEKRLSHEQAVAYINQRWGSLLKRLAE